MLQVPEYLSKTFRRPCHQLLSRKSIGVESCCSLVGGSPTQPNSVPASPQRSRHFIRLLIKTPFKRKRIGRLAEADDLNSFSLGPIALPNQLVIPPAGISDFSTTADLRPAKNILVAVNAHLDRSTGLLTWTFQSLDP